MFVFYCIIIIMNAIFRYILLFKSGGGGVAVIDMVYLKNTQFTRQEIILYASLKFYF